MTLSPSDWELLHREVDGETTDREAAGLRERLASERELREAYEALTGVGRALSEVGLVDPPPALVADVMREVKRGSGTAETTGGLRLLGSWVRQQPALALAASLAVGLLAGLLVTGRGLVPMDGSAVSGTLLPPGHLATLPLVDEARLEGTGLSARAATRHGRGAVVVETELLSGGPVALSIDVDAAALAPRGVECVDGRPLAAAAVVIEPGRVRVRQLSAGRCFVSLTVLAPGADAGAVAIHMEGPAGAAEASLRAGAPAVEGREGRKRDQLPGRWTVLPFKAARICDLDGGLRARRGGRR